MPTRPHIIAGARVVVAVIALVSLAAISVAVGVHPASAKAKPATLTTGQAIVQEAANEAGVPYCEGGGGDNGPTLSTNGYTCATPGFDCMSLAQYAVYQVTGQQVPANGEGLPGGTDWNGEGTAIGKDQADLEPGDVVFFGGSDLWHYAHSGIYAGGGEVWDALQTGTPVEEHTVAALTADYGGTYQGAVRYTGTVTDTPPVITTQPKRQKVASGAMATFTAAASGTPTPTVQWESKAKAKGSAWTDVTGGTSDTLSFTATTAETGSTYEAVFANSAGTKTTKKVKLTVT